jgi:hypothetical protein
LRAPTKGSVPNFSSDEKPPITRQLEMGGARLERATSCL